jgi:hypothetical protein
MAHKEGPGDYAVGYGRPPEHSRFRKGQSGNPRGKVKGRKSLKSILADELSARMTIGINGKQVTASRQQLMVQTLTARAAAGDTRAAKMVIELVLQVFGADGQDGARQPLSVQDQRILDQLLVDFGGRDGDQVATEGQGEDSAP